MAIKDESTNNYTQQQPQPQPQQQPQQQQQFQNYGTTHFYIQDTMPQNNRYDCIYLYHISRTLKILSIIDFICTFLYIFISWPLVFLCILPMCGYYGAKYYKTNLIMIYIIFNILNILGKIYQVYYGIKYNYVFNIIIGSLSILVSAYIIKLCYNFNDKIKYLSVSNNNILNILRNNWRPYQNVFQTV